MKRQRRVAKQRAGDGDALALAAGELHAALADMGVVAAAALPILELHDELVGVGEPGGRDHLVVAGVGAAVADVVAN